MKKETDGPAAEKKLSEPHTVAPRSQPSLKDTLRSAIVPLVLAGVSYFAGKTKILYGIPLGITLICLLLTFPPKKWIKWAAFTFCLLCWLVTFLWIRHDEALQSRSFTVRLLGSVIDSRSLEGQHIWFAHRTQFGPTLSPVQAVLTFRVVNLQSVPVLIDRYRVSILVPDPEVAPLQHMNLRYGDAFIGPKSGTDVMSKIDATSSLDYILGSRAIQPHETIQGFALFEVPPEDIAALKDACFSVVIRDTADSEYTISGPETCTNSKDDANQGLQTPAFLHILPETAKFDSFHRAYYTDFYK